MTGELHILDTSILHPFQDSLKGRLVEDLFSAAAFTSMDVQGFIQFPLLLGLMGSRDISSGFPFKYKQDRTAQDERGESTMAGDNDPAQAIRIHISTKSIQCEPVIGIKRSTTRAFMGIAQFLHFTLLRVLVVIGFSIINPRESFSRKVFPMTIHQAYPGRPEVAVQIQSDIAAVTAGLTMPVACSCGRQPIIVSFSLGISQVKCFCGRSGIPARGQAAAVERWNLSWGM